MAGDIWTKPPSEYQRAAIEKLCKSLSVDDYIKDPPHTIAQARGMMYRLLRRLEDRDNTKYTNHAKGRKEPSLKVPPSRDLKPEKPMQGLCLIKWALKEKQSGILLGIPSEKKSIFTPMTFDNRDNARTLKKSIFEPIGIQAQVIKVAVRIEEIYSRG